MPKKEKKTNPLKIVAYFILPLVTIGGIYAFNQLKTKPMTRIKKLKEIKITRPKGKKK